MQNLLRQIFGKIKSFDYFKKIKKMENFKETIRKINT